MFNNLVIWYIVLRSAKQTFWNDDMTLSFLMDRSEKKVTKYFIYRYAQNFMQFIFLILKDTNMLNNHISIFQFICQRKSLSIYPQLIQLHMPVMIFFFIKMDCVSYIFLTLILILYSQISKIYNFHTNREFLSG